MPGRIPAVPVAALFAASFSLFVFAPQGDVSAADSCLTAPDKAAPQGSRWYYRLEHPSKRKCWRLVSKDQKERRAAKAAPQPEPDDETASVPPPASPPPAVTQAPPTPQAKPAPVVTTLVTRNVSNDGGMPQQMLIPPTDAPPSTQIASAEPQPPAAAEAPAPLAAAEPMPAQPAPPAQAAASTTAPTGGTTWTMLFVAGGLLALFGCAAILILTLVRRQTDVLKTIRDREEKLPFEASPEMAPQDHVEEHLREDAPSFAPLPPMVRPVRVQVDDLDDALQEYTRRQRRRAA